jgi:signal transduction histidine kinase
MEVIEKDRLSRIASAMPDERRCQGGSTHQMITIRQSTRSIIQSAQLPPARMTGVILMAAYLRDELLYRVQTDPDLFQFLEQGCLDGLWYWDLDQPGHEWLSPRFKAFFGFDEHEMADSPEWWQANIDPADMAAAQAQVGRCLVNPDEPFDMILKYRHRLGHSVWVRCRGLVIRDESGRPIRMLGAHTDMTEIMQRDNELADTNLRLLDAVAEARAANAAKTHFLAKMSHEIRTPMTGVLGMADLLARTPLDAEQQRMVETIRRSGALLLATLNDILDISKIEAGGLVLESSPLSLDDIAAQVESLHRARASESATRLTVRVEGGARWREGDAHRLLQILNNLLSNALKFAAGQWVEVMIEAPRGQPVTIGVRDGGPGMSADAAAGIFEGYRQADASITRRYGGTGLGLAIVRSLVEAMHGTVGLDTAPGAGAFFEITLPLREAAPTVALQAGLDGITGPPLDGLSVLACDDNEVNRMVLAGFLEMLGVHSRIFEDGEALLREAESGRWDVYLIDIVMPGMDGLETLSALREQTGVAAPPAIACTANAMPEQVRDYAAAGFAGHLPKPVNVASLRAALVAATAAMAFR